MSSGLRQPLPWESDQTPRRVVHALDPVEVSLPYEVAAAAKLVVSLVDPDPHRARRGAALAARWTHDEMTKIGLSPTLSEVRARVDVARAKASHPGR